MSQPDRMHAAAESQLERLDDVVDGEDVQVPPATDVEAEEVAAEEYGFHVEDLEDPDAGLLTEEAAVTPQDDTRADALDAVAEAFNARDLDSLLELLAVDGEAPGLSSYDRGDLPAAVHDLWQRRPTCRMTRGGVEDEHVGVIWEHDGARWWPVAVVHVDDIVDDIIGVLEIGDDPDLLEQLVAEPPDGDMEEGALWTEWDEGADGDT